MARVSPLRCAVAVLPCQGGDARRSLRSVEEAFRRAPGDFSDIVPLAEAEIGAAAEAAAREDCDWLFVTTSAEEVVPDLFAKIAPALRLHDAVWGGAALAAADGSAPKLEQITRLAAQDLPSFFHAALRWWIGPTHFVRPRLAAGAARQVDGAVGRANYMMHLWRHGRACKTAQCLTVFHGALPPLAPAERDRLVASLAAEPVFMSVSHEAVTVRLPYTGLNPVIEREQMRGRFFEAEELGYLAGRLPRGMTIVDAGANTGNHTAFFAAAMQAAAVVPIEPDKRASAAIRATVAANGLGNVDLSKLGVALGDREARLRPVFSEGGGLGATKFVADPEGVVRAAPLDRLIGGRVDFVKIDVEGMEMAVLAGAAGLVSRCRPVLFVEVVDSRAGEFTAWVDANSYRFERLFPDKTHCNCLVVPAEYAVGGQAGGNAT